MSRTRHARQPKLVCAHIKELTALRADLESARADVARMRDYRDKLRAVLKEALVYVEREVIETDPEHSCGPESNCDGVCVDHARAAQVFAKGRLLLKARAALDGKGATK